MDLDNLRELTRAYERAGKAVTAAEGKLTEAKAHKVAVREQLAEAIVDHANAGIPQHQIVDVTPYTRERVRQITNAVNEARERAAQEASSGVPSES